MDSYKICFIMCANKEFLAEECMLYLGQLEVPEGFTVEIKTIYGAACMTGGYNKAMKESDAKYKVYLHQDVLIINRRFLYELIGLFQSEPQIGMFGVVGNKSLALDGCPWSDGNHRRIGELYCDLIKEKEHCVFSNIQGKYQEALVLDGLLLATQYDLPWREDLFQGWDFYDCSQSLEFWKAGYKVVVPHMEKPWCLHDNDIVDLRHYEKWRVLFEREYGRYYKNWERWRDREWDNMQSMSGSGKKVIYQRFDGKKTLLSFPYPPVFQEKGVDYLCFTEDAGIHSKYWEMRYVENLKELDLLEELLGYTEKYELRTDQIQIGSLFSGNPEWEMFLTIPPLQELPEISFQPEKMVSTSDGKGNYKYKKNPEYVNGKYHGRPLLLTVGVPVSNQIDTIEKCLSHVKPLLDQLESELLVIDTGSTDGTLDVCKSYGARIVRFPWCDNMSAARNEGIRHARGAWYLSIDDDEWFEDVGDILRFFQSGTYRDCDLATYIQRNYQLRSGEIYHDNHVVRMARITPELHFEGRIHDVLMVPFAKKHCQLSSYAHHYGFVSDDKEKAKEKYKRNVSILLYDICEYPENLRYNFQLANELKCECYFEQALAYFFRGLSIEREVPDEYSGRLHAVNMLSCLHDAKDKRMFRFIGQMQQRYPMTEAENACLSYNQAELAVLYQRPEEEVLRYCKQYGMYRKRYEKNPYDSNQRTFLGLHACTNEAYIVNAHVIAFCAYIRKGEHAKAYEELKGISIDKILNHRRNFFEHVVISEEKVYQAALEKITPLQWETWKTQLLEICFANSAQDETKPYLAGRFSEIVKKFSVEEIKCFVQEAGRQMTNIVKQWSSNYVKGNIGRGNSVQEICFYGHVLKEQYVQAGKKEKDMALFRQYVEAMGAFAGVYYNQALLEDFKSHAIPADIHAAYAIRSVLMDGKKTSQNIRKLKQALEIFPGFKSEIQYFLEQLTEPKQLSPEEEMDVLAKALKSQIATLLEEGKCEEAKPMLQELARYFPQDQEIQEMLRKAMVTR